jgi:APA family basic amino acid/polyamine antiporter
VFPEVLAYVDPRFDTPVVALLVMGIPPLFLVPIADELVGLAAFIGLASLTAYFFSAVGLWNLPREFPEHYENAAFMLKRERGLLMAVVAGALATAAFWVVSLLRLPVVGVVLVGWFVLGYVAYRYRVSLGDPAETFRTMTSLAEHEAAFARNRGSDVEKD